MRPQHHRGHGRGGRDRRGKVADDVGLTVSVIGTPAEEGGGGKILLLERGAFDGVHAAMMVHPAPLDVVELPIIAADQFDVHYTGKEAHASAFPELGINAADALTIAQTAIGLLRQHIGDGPHPRHHHEGRRRAEHRPGPHGAKYIVRAKTLDELEEIRAKVMRCFEAGALATGATSSSWAAPALCRDAPRSGDGRGLPSQRGGGRPHVPDFGPVIERGGSTDMGNVSLAMPSIHPTIGIDSLPAVNHQPEFTAHCVTPAADKALFDGALAMAWTCVDLASDAEQVARLTAPR